jgi:hypothetical protein
MSTAQQVAPPPEDPLKIPRFYKKPDGSVVELSRNGDYGKPTDAAAIDRLLNDYERLEAKLLVNICGSKMTAKIITHKFEPEKVTATIELTPKIVSHWICF